MPFPREIDEGRVMRGQEIAKLEGQIKRLDESTYQVHSQSGHGLYTVVKGSVIGVAVAQTTSTEK